MTLTAVVTGANRGIGYAVAEGLLAAGAHVLLLCRDRERGLAAREQLGRRGSGRAELVLGSLDSLRSIRLAALAVQRAAPRLDLLVHNAGIWPSQLERNEDGLERAFVVNHLAPFLLNHLLLAQLGAGNARVVQVSAGLAVKGKPSLAATPSGADFSALGTYATTKLCNLLLLDRFASHFRPHGVTINALHPGVIRTGLGDRSGPLGLLLRLVKRLWKSPEQGAQPVLRLALDPALAGISGCYFDGEREVARTEPLCNEGLADELWQQAEQLCGLRGAPSAI